MGGSPLLWFSVLSAFLSLPSRRDVCAFAISLPGPLADLTLVADWLAVVWPAKKGWDPAPTSHLAVAPYCILPLGLFCPCFPLRPPLPCPWAAASRRCACTVRSPGLLVLPRGCGLSGIPHNLLWHDAPFLFRLHLSPSDRRPIRYQRPL